MVQVKQMLVSSRAVTSGEGNLCNYIVIHETANTSKGANAYMHAKLQRNGFTASWHYTVDDEEVYQSYPDAVKCWHAGDGGNGKGNGQGIGIEICVNSDGDFKKAVENAAELVKYLMKKHNIPQSNVIQHNVTSSWGKNCPANLRSGKIVSWADFNRMIDGSGGTVSAPTTETNPSIVDKPSSKPKKQWTKVNGSWTGQTLRNGQYGSPVKQLQTKLGVKADSYFGDDTENAVRKIQRNAGITVDGLAGKATFKALGGANLKVDGYWGAATTRALQRYFNTPVDGVISRVSPMIKKLQKLVGTKADGIRGPKTYRAMQKRFGTPVDGKISKPSVMVKEMQRRLNKGKL